MPMMNHSPINALDTSVLRGSTQAAISAGKVNTNLPNQRGPVLQIDLLSIKPIDPYESLESFQNYLTQNHAEMYQLAQEAATSHCKDLAILLTNNKTRLNKYPKILSFIQDHLVPNLQNELNLLNS